MGEASNRRYKKRRLAEKSDAPGSIVQKRRSTSAIKKLKPSIIKRNHKFLFLLASLAFVALISSIVFISGHFFLFSPVRGDEHLNVLLITLDTTRADRLGCYGYPKAATPNIDWVASEGIRFANAYAQVPLTFPSHCSIMTGTYPLYHGTRNNGTYHLPPDLMTLAEILKNNGFLTAAFVSSFTVDSRFGLDQGFDVYDDEFRPGQAFKSLNAERRAEEVFKAFSAWLDRNYNHQFFCWLHFFDPHFPYDPPSPFKEKFSADPYDGEIAYMDFFVGKVIEKLKEKNLLAQTILILAGDHGEAFGEKGETGHGVFLYEETLRVPLILAAKGHLPAKKVIGGRVRLIDLMPTILELVKIPLPEKIQGESLLPYLRKKRAKELPNYIETYFPRENYGWSELKGIMEGPWKYIEAPKKELYDLKKDPGENINLAETRPGEIARWQEKLKSYLTTYSSPFLAPKRKMTAEEKEKLRTLGYISLAEETSSDNLPDPKDRRDELKLIAAAEVCEVEQKFEEAAGLYEELLNRHPESPTNYINLALVYAQLNRFDQAVELLEKGLEKKPQSLLLLSRLGHTYLAMGRLKKALDTWQRVLSLEPTYFDALLSSAWILGLLGQKEEARIFYERALSIEPENRFGRMNLALILATTGEILAAVKMFETLAADFPDDYEVWQNLGIAYGYMGEIDKAAQSLEKAIVLKATPTAYFNLAVAKKKQGHIEEAIKYLKLYLDNSAGEDAEKIRSARYELLTLEKSLRR